MMSRKNIFLKLLLFCLVNGYVHADEFFDEEYWLAEESTEVFIESESECSEIADVPINSFEDLSIESADICVSAETEPSTNDVSGDIESQLPPTVEPNEPAVLSDDFTETPPVTTIEGNETTIEHVDEPETTLVFTDNNPEVEPNEPEVLPEDFTETPPVATIEGNETTIEHVDEPETTLVLTDNTPEHVESQKPVVSSPTEQVFDELETTANGFTSSSPVPTVNKELEVLPEDFTETPPVATIEGNETTIEHVDEPETTLVLTDNTPEHVESQKLVVSSPTEQVFDELETTANDFTESTPISTVENIEVIVGEVASDKLVPQSETTFTSEETTPDTFTQNSDLSQSESPIIESNLDWLVLPIPTQINNADIQLETRPSTALVIDLNIETDNMQALTLQSVLNGKVINNGDGTITYTPDPEFFGIESFYYTYFDTDHKRQKKKVEITVRETIGEPPQPMACQIYATHVEGNGHTQLITIDPIGYSAVALGPLYQQYAITGIAADPVTHKLYAISGESAVADQAGMLYLVNAHTGELVTVGNTHFGGLTALAFHPDASLWAWSKEEGIIQVDKATGRGTLVAPVPSTEVIVSPPKTNLPENSVVNPTQPAKNQTEVEENALTGTVLFVDAVTDNGTRRGTRKETTKTIKLKNMQGLAWDSEGTMLYSTYGYKRTLWTFDPKTSTFNQACDNLPGQISALETLADGMLMFAVPQKSAGKVYGNKIYVYDPVHCEIVLNRSFVTPYAHLESVAWPTNCQTLPEVESWKISFDGNVNTTMCLNTPQWITLQGVANLNPADSRAYLETGWNITAHSNKVNCPPANPNCTETQQAAKQIIRGKTEFSITGWWPGLPDEGIVETHYTANLLDMNGKRLSGKSHIEKTLVGSTDLCNKPIGEQAICAGEDCPCSTCAEENAKQDAKWETQQPYDSVAVENYLANTDYAFAEDNTTITVRDQGQPMQFAFADLLAKKVLPTGKFNVETIEDINADGYTDYRIIYPDGTIQQIYYLGTP